jgi:hypothetical protein
VLFDLDGTLLDGAGHWQSAWSELVRESLDEVPAGALAELDGLSTPDAAALVFARGGQCRGGRLPGRASRAHRPRLLSRCRRRRPHRGPGPGRGAGVTAGCGQCLAQPVTVAAVTTAALRRALTDPGEPPLRPLPDQVNELLESLHAPPRLAAHLRAVHDVAGQLTEALAARFPSLDFDRTAVLFGAATHDIGKTVHIGEPGTLGGIHGSRRHPRPAGRRRGRPARFPGRSRHSLNANAPPSTPRGRELGAYFRQNADLAGLWRAWV